MRTHGGSTQGQSWQEAQEASQGCLEGQRAAGPGKGDPVTYRSPEGAVTTEVAAVQRGVRWKWHRSGESGIGEVTRAHVSLLAAWKAMDNLSEDL